MLPTLTKSWYFDNSRLLIASLGWTALVSSIALGLVAILPAMYLPFLFLLVLSSAIVLKWFVDGFILAHFRHFDQYFRLGLQQRGISSSLPDKSLYTLHQWYDLYDQVLDRLYQDAHTITEIEEEYQSILDSQSEFVFKIDENGFMIYSNRAFEELAQIDTADEGHFLVQDFRIDNVISRVIASQDKLLDDLRSNKEGREFASTLLLGDKKVIVKWHALCVRDHIEDDHSARSYVFVGRDITLATLLGERARKLESLATVGRSASFICHEVSQPLSVIELATRNLIDLHKDGLLSDEDLEQKATKILSQVTRISKITRELTNFGRASLQKDVQFCVNELISNIALEESGQLINSQVDLRWEEPTETFNVNGSPTLFRQVIHNLLKNSDYALRQAKPSMPFIRIELAHINAATCIRVIDNAGGVPESDFDVLTMPFYSTKPLGEGSGIGLAYCFDVIQKMKGSIRCENTPDGLMVSISLPSALQSIESAA